MFDLNTAWFLLVSILIIGYAILDGFDLGVGVISLFTRKESNKQLLMNVAGPVWDGNEIWLIAAGIALFGAFPLVFSIVANSLYPMFTILVAALIIRIVSLGLGNKSNPAASNKVWGTLFGYSSLIAAFILGVAFGNILRGIPLDMRHNFTGSVLEFLNPYSLLVGLTGVVMFVMHGAVYMCMKTEGENRDIMQKWATIAWMAFAGLYAITTLATFFAAPHLFDGLFHSVAFWFLFLVLLLVIVYIPVGVTDGKYFKSFMASSTTILCMISLSAVSLFPRFVPSTTDLLDSLTIYNASSSPDTLATMLFIALVAIPLVVGYTIFSYKSFKVT